MGFKACLIAFVVFSLCVVTKAELHEFNLPDGRSIKAEIVDFNGRLGLVELRLENGKVKKVKPALFVEADQAFIKNWAELSGFRSPSSFKVSGKKKQIEKWKNEEEGQIRYSDGSVETEVISVEKFEKFNYELLLENRNATSLEGITLKYCIFYEQSVASGSGTKRSEAVMNQKVVSGAMDVPALKANGKAVLTTKPVVIHEKEWSGDYLYAGGDPIKEQGDIHGVWIRVSMTGADGEPVIRDIYEPSGIQGKFTWKE
ncbi:hypothetical protein [Pontiella agarivorans]|uniref:Uncharacterized protein n=1 Tax=Pontiella agarivorans TaxID=3038953 RepID=A0ABU5MZF8_9BACT|nr:hypothetical protein [Pontiella agarivorans]MDZ8119567.1 hypothetical protein [Pontiella agarivorans]